MTIIDGFYNKECNKIDPSCINAFFELGLSEENPTELYLDNSWGKTSVDLLPAIKAGETMTYLKLAPANNPAYLEYDPENGIPQCIHGDDLSRIISMKLLKDVKQTNLTDGDVYMWNSTTNQFEPFNLANFVTAVNTALTNLGARVTNLETDVAEIKAILARPSGIPSDVRLVWGDINLYSDYTNNNNRQHGFFTHSTSTNKANDEYFA